MKREKYRAKNESLPNTLTDSKGATFVILINHTSTLMIKERLSPMGKARREVSRNKFLKKSGMPNKVKSFQETNSSENRQRARPEFVKPIQNGPRKEQNLIQNRSFMAKLTWR